MVQGIETDNDKLGKVKKSDEKWLTKDLHDIKKTVEHYIDEVRPDDENDEDYIVKTQNTKVFKYVIFLLGLIGLIALFAGIFLLSNSNYMGGIPLIVFGGLLQKVKVSHGL